MSRKNTGAESTRVTWPEIIADFDRLTHRLSLALAECASAEYDTDQHTWPIAKMQYHVLEARHLAQRYHNGSIGSTGAYQPLKA